MIRFRSCCLAILLLPAAAFAALGEDLRSVEADRIAMKASVRELADLRSATPRFTVHEILTPEGTRLREFVAPSGKVFAVSWDGNFMPNLRQALGNSFEPWQAAVRMQRRGRSPVSVMTPDLVVHSRGRMRAFFGLAYLPGALPAGVAVSELH